MLRFASIVKEQGKVGTEELSGPNLDTVNEHEALVVSSIE